MGTAHGINCAEPCGCAGCASSIQEAGTKCIQSLEFAMGDKEMQAGSVDASPTSGSSPSATTCCCSATDGVWGEVKNQNKKVFFDKILDTYIRFLHRIGVLCGFLWCCHLCCRAGQDVMGSHVLSCPMGAQREHRSRRAIGHSEGAIKPSWGYREFLYEVWGSGPPCLALLCPLLTPTAAFCSSPSCWVVGRSPFGNSFCAHLVSVPC